MDIALWGCGGMGNSLANALLGTGEARLAAVYDLDPAAAAAAAERYGAQTAPSPEALLAQPGLAGVIIALPGDQHAPATIQTAQAGLGIFVEKPMSVTVAGCQEMLAAARRYGVGLMVGQVVRWYEPYRTILRWQAEGRFGRLFAASIWRVMDGRVWPQDHWRLSHASSGGPLLEVGAHELDMLRCMFGRPDTVHAIAHKSLPTGGEWADFIAVQIRFTDGTTATYESGAGSHAGRYGFRLFFEGATLTSEAAFDRNSLRAFGPGGKPIEIDASEFSDERPVEAELRGWLAALRGDAPMPVPGEEGMATVALAEAAYRSAATGQIVAYQSGA
ncbi:MAG: Gfo/Idh/MocA family oxidoreductase [Anaerolineales bacterium]|nr:Gfo/Idh/MocA family oxidoreductase [Anaerolineales bacterium]